MTIYTDYYWDSAEMSAFLPLLTSEPNIIGPLAGDPPGAPGTQADRWYIAVRTSTPLSVPAGCVATDPVVAQGLLGVWA